MTTGILHDQKHIDKQMGCMAGIFQQFLTGKRLHTTKRLPPSTTTQAADPVPGPEKSRRSPEVSTELERSKQTTVKSPRQSRPGAHLATDLRSPAPEVVTPAELQAKLSLPLPIFELKDGTKSSWKFCKETPRLSLDSRATVDANGGLCSREIQTNNGDTRTPANRCENTGDGGGKRGSPTVIARLMGLEPLPHSSTESVKKVEAELRRSASESRLSRELYQYRFVDGNNFQVKQQNQPQSVGSNKSTNVTRDNAAPQTAAAAALNARSADPTKFSAQKAMSEPPWKSAQQRRSFFDPEDFFPEPKQSVSIYGEIERRLKKGGIDEPSNDLEALKQILEALQLKGLLHSADQIRHRTKPSMSPVSPIKRRSGNDSPQSGFRSGAGVPQSLRITGDCLTTMSPRRDRPEIDRNVCNHVMARNSGSPTRRESNAESANSPVRRRPSSVEAQRNANEFVAQRRASPVHSPKVSPKRNGHEQTIKIRYLGSRKPTAEIDPKESTSFVEDESSSVSESSVSTSSQTDAEGVKMKEYNGGMSLLERCDKLLHSIAEITANELQPSPVSVLDSSFYKDESSSPSPVINRSIDFKDQLGEYEGEIWSQARSPMQIKFEDESNECDFIYISKILQASNYHLEDSDAVLLLEKQQYLKGKDTSNVSRLQRKLIFDTIKEILDRNRRLPPWKALSWSINSNITEPSLRQIWSEFQRIRERDTHEDLFDMVCSMLRRDLAGDAVNGWGDYPVEMLEAVLEVERLVFKDLVVETLGDMETFAGNERVSSPCRKLVF